MAVSLLQYKQDQTVVVIKSWLTMPTFSIRQGTKHCGKLESVSTCNRWIRPYYSLVQNTIHAALMKKLVRLTRASRALVRPADCV
jgi:hypothetical protein